MDISKDKIDFNGDEIFYLGKLREYLIEPNVKKEIFIEKKDGEKFSLKVLSRIDTENEIKYFESDGILPYVMNKI